MSKATQLSAARTPQRSSSGNDLDGNALFEALVCEFHWTALQIGGICQIFNNARARKTMWMIRSCRNILPVEGSVIRFALSNHSETGISHQHGLALKRLFLNLTDAKNWTEALLDGLGSIGVSPQQSQRLEQIGAVWRQLAADSLEAVQSLEPETRWRISGRYSENALVLAKFLKEALAGGHGSVDALGNVILPVLPQRRREPRFVLLQPCKIAVRNVVLNAIARDVSRNGLGLSCDAQLRLRDAVVVELASGRRLKGRIVWVRDGLQGLQLDVPLPSTDPLIAA